MNRQWRGFVLGFSALGSLLLGGILAWVLGVFEMGSSEIPVKEMPGGILSSAVFSAPETLQDGSVKSIAESWPDSSDKKVEYYLSENGKKHLTAVVEYFISGAKEKEIEYGKGDQEGILRVREWFSKGGASREYSEKNGKKNGEFAEYWENGFCKARGVFLDGKSEGVWHFWDNQGIRMETSSFRNGAPHGYFKRWSPEGYRIMSGQYTEGQPSGEWKWYNEQGVIKTRNYSDPQAPEIQGEKSE